MTAVAEVVGECSLPWLPIDVGTADDDAGEQHAAHVVAGGQTALANAATRRVLAAVGLRRRSPGADAAGGVPGDGAAGIRRPADDTTGEDHAVAPAATWYRFGDLASADALAGLLETVQNETDGLRDVATAFLAGRLAWPLARLTAVPVVTRGRALQFDSAALWLRFDERGLVTSVRVDGATLSPEADGRQARAAAYAAAAAQAVDSYRPVVTALHGVGALGERALWGQLADTLIGSVGDALGNDPDPAMARAHADLLLRSCDPPLWVPSRYDVGVRDGEEVLTWRRGSCCLAYRLPRFGLCSGCPLQDE